MKNLVGIVLLSLIVSSCNLFQKPSMTQENIDAMVAENSALKSQLTKSKDMEDQLAMARMQLDEAMLKLSACEEGAKSKVHIITGAFKISSNANDFSGVMQSSGHDGNIIPGPYNFNLVTASSHESINAALNALAPIRENVILTAWIYIE